MKKQTMMIAAAAIAAAGLFAGRFALRAQDADAAGLLRSAADAVRHANYEEADYLCAKAASSSDKPEIAPALWYLGARAAGMGNRLAAEGFFDRLLKLEPDGPHTARVLTWLANLHIDEAATAEEFFRRALELEEAKSLDVSETARSYAVLLRKEGRQAEVEAMEQRARSARGGPKNAPAS